MQELWRQLKTAKEISEEGKDPISERQAMASALQNLEKTGVLEDAISNCQKKHKKDGTWKTLKNTFTMRTKNAGEKQPSEAKDIIQPKKQQNKRKTKQN